MILNSISGNNLSRIDVLLDYCKQRYAKNSFSRWIFWSLRGYAYSCLMQLIKPGAVGIINSDVLILHPSEKSRRLDRKRELIDCLKSKGLLVSEDVVLDEFDIIKQRKYKRSGFGLKRLRIYDGYAKYLKFKYSPKVIVTERNGCILSSFLKSKKNTDPITFHLAHSVLTSQSSRYNFIDFDIYSIYGKSSLEYLEQIKNKYGFCRVFEGGSYLFGNGFDLPVKSDGAVLFLGAGPDIEESESCVKLYQLVVDWQSQSGENLFVRLHPRSHGKFWKGQGNKNIIVLENQSFVDSARICSIVISPYTNAVLDAALLKRPVQFIRLDPDNDYLQVERFFGPAAENACQLKACIEKIRSEYSSYVKKSYEFSNYHVSSGSESVDIIASHIYSICKKNILSI